MGDHRGQGTRPRYGRIGVLASSVTVTAVAVLGGAGMLPSSATTHAPRHEAALTADAVPAQAPGPGPSATRSTGHADRAAKRLTNPVTSRGSADAVELRERTMRDRTLPVRSGEGRRVVFSEGRQRVWLVGAHDRVRRTYPVSGSVYDNLAPGTYSVFSRSEQAWGIDDSGTMRYFVRFAHGHNAAIGFHDIPVADGRLVQSVTQLGTPQSHGCIRQRRTDAVALWRFAPLGTTVVVV